MTKLIAKFAEKYAKLGATSVFLFFHQPKAPNCLVK